MEFLGLSNQQQAAIRDWTSQIKTLPQSAATTTTTKITDEREGVVPGGLHPGGPRRRRRRRRGRRWMGVLVAVTGLLAGVSGRWNRGWQGLEAALNGHLTPS